MIPPARTSDADRRPIAFVEVTPAMDASGDGDAAGEPVAGTVPSVNGALTPGGEPRWELWGDADR